MSSLTMTTKTTTTTTNLQAVLAKKSKSRSDMVGRRKWHNLDKRNARVFAMAHIFTFLAPFYFTWAAFGVAFGLGAATILFGITLSYHRNLTHGSFKLRPKCLEYFFAYIGLLALQGDPIEWVSNHRYHHKFTDTEKDLHSPLEGFWFSHMGWLFNKDLITQKRGVRNNVGDLEKQGFYIWLRKTQFIHHILLTATLLGFGGLPFLFWGMGVRLLISFHITFLVNSVCHVWGNIAWKTHDLSRNNWWVAILTFGEGWHNNHHAFQYSARHGLEWWQLDLTWYFILFLQALGLATDVKLPTEFQKRKLALNSEDKHSHSI